MKKIRKENQYTGGKGNIDDERRPRLNYTRNGKKERGLIGNEAEPNDYEDRDIRENDDYRLRANRPASRSDGSQSNQPKIHRDNNHNSKIGSVKAEMQIRARGNYGQEKSSNRNGERENAE